MGIFKTLVSVTWALLMGVLVLKRSMALNDVAEIIDSIQSCDMLSDSYHAGGADITVRLKGDMACAEAKVRPLLLCALYNVGVVCAFRGLYRRNISVAVKEMHVPGRHYCICIIYCSNPLPGV